MTSNRSRVILLASLIVSAPLSAQQAPSRLEAPVAAQDTGRAKAIEYSDAYYTRLTIHRYGSYAILPLFATQFLLGERLLNGGEVPGWVKPAHIATASATGAVFAVNTVTGAMNLWESRHEPTNRTRRYLHAAAMITAEAGFAYTGLVASQDAADLDDGARRHRDIALGSMALSGTSVLLMWLLND